MFHLKPSQESVKILEKGCNILLINMSKRNNLYEYLTYTHSICYLDTLSVILFHFEKKIYFIIK